VYFVVELRARKRYIMNTAVLVGRVGRDAEIRYFESGKVKANFSVAVNRWDSKTKSEVTDWFNIDVWDKLAEFAGEYVKKGIQLVIDGRIAQNKWVDKATGNDRESFLVIANNIRLLGSKRDIEQI
jgi:single-strand DNA-binding protein